MYVKIRVKAILVLNSKYACKTIHTYTNEFYKIKALATPKNYGKAERNVKDSTIT